MEMFENATHKKWLCFYRCAKTNKRLYTYMNCNHLVNEDSALYTNVIQNYEYLAIFL